LENGATPLHFAVELGHKQVVQLLVAGGADSTVARTSDGSTPMYIALRRGGVEMVQLLLVGEGIVMAARADDSSTTLYKAAQEGKLDVVRMLLDGGADVNRMKIGTGETPLHAAAQNGHLEIVRRLILGGADVNKPRSDSGATPLAVASQIGHYNIVLILLKGGAVETTCSASLLSEITGDSASAGCEDRLASRLRISRLLARWRCAMCDKSLRKEKTCAQCQRVSYCSKECQREHWDRHKPACTDSRAPEPEDSQRQRIEDVD
jgi:ankyrin repeat protein